MKVLSLFDGISCSQVALNRSNIIIDKYFASEIDKNAIRVTQSNYPNTIQVGNVLNIKSQHLPNIDLLVGGSPCQGFSFAGKQLNFNDSRSKLFFEFLRILEEKSPKYFLLENVKMKIEYQDVISNYLGVKPIQIDSSLVSAQKRTRLYWTNINVNIPENKNIFLKDIIIDGVVDKDKSYCIDASYNRNANPFSYIKKCRGSLVFDCDDNLKLYRSYNRQQLLSKDVINNNCWRKLYQNELEILQTLPINYTNCLSYNNAAKCIGNGMTVDVIAHIFNNIK